MRDTLMRVRELRDPGRPSSEDDVLPLWLVAGGHGAGAALASATMIVVLCVLGWLTGAGGSESAGATVAAGLAGWAFAHGAPLTLDAGRVGLIPWLLLAWPLVCAWWSAQRVVPDPASKSRRLRGFGAIREDVAVAGGAFVTGYAATALVLAVAAHFGGARPSIGFATFGGIVLATLAYLLALRPLHHLGDLAPRLQWAQREYVPSWVGRAVRPAAAAVLATLAAGAVVLVVGIVLRFGEMAEVYARIGGGPVGITLMTLAQLAYLPTLAMWAASWLAGPGFTLGGGSSVTWFVSDPGIIPLVPVLATVPTPGPLPTWSPAVVTVPLLIGLMLGIWCVRRAGGTWLERLRLTGVAVVLYALAILVLGVAASGSVGAGYFAHVGLDAVVTALALTGEVGLTALAVAGISGLRVARPGRRRNDSRSGTSATSTRSTGSDKGGANKPRRRLRRHAEDEFD
ncbi:cell division protein PerM [Mobilicoccus massiliensis]|uniref:cell division protein PerM n=1 Tax=Mobilicoccus massiliensis TaxID=1522310 RepID=UPI00059040B2|nr:DUF6350 family protein [Mobilicoccus massiliensis]